MKKLIFLIILSALLLTLTNSCSDPNPKTGIVGVDRLYILRDAEILMVNEESSPWWSWSKERKLSFTILPAQMVIDYYGTDPLSVELKASRKGQVWPDAMYVEKRGKIKHASLACIIDEESFLTCMMINGELSVSCLDEIQIGSLSAETKKQFTKGIHVLIE